jgi:uncharacterized protein with FMN-binding domain
MKGIKGRLIGAIAALAIGLCSCASVAGGERPNPDLASIPDGTYTGEVDVFIVHVTAEVTVASGLITAFELLEHRCSDHGRPAEALVAQVLEKQSFELDAVSGATLSSKAILNAGKDALILDE